MGQELSECIERREQRLREQLNEACRLARDLDERVRSIPAGKLLISGAGGSGVEGDHRPAAAAACSSCTSTQLRISSIAIATSDVVAAFNEAVKVLLQSSCTLSVASPPPPRQADRLYSSPPRPKDVSTTSSTVLHGSKAINLAGEQLLYGARSLQMKSPPLSPCSRPSHLYRQHLNMPSATTATPSPPRTTIHSPLLSAATSEMSDGSPTLHLDLPSADEATTASNPVKAVVIDRKRKLLPKVTLKMRAGSAEAAENNTPPDDGHTWRKYGQKDILGACYPRSYYRCTHKTDVGCPAVKQVQRWDEDGSLFDVIYKGYHTCRSAEIDRECWPLAFSQGPVSSSFLNFHPKYSSSSSSTMSPSANIPPTPAAAAAPAAAASLMLANNNMCSARHISAGHGNYASLDSLQVVGAHQLLHGVSSAAAPPSCLPFINSSANADLSVSQAGQGIASCSAADQCNSYFAYIAPMVSAPPLIYLNSDPQPMSGGVGAPSTHPYPPLQFNDVTQDRSSVPQKETATSSNYIVGGDNEAHGSRSVREQGRAFDPLEDWQDFERESYERRALKASNNEGRSYSVDEDVLAHEAGMYGSLNTTLGSILKPFARNILQQQVTMLTASSSEQQEAAIPRRPLPSPTSTCASNQQTQSAANSAALTFDTCMDHDDLLGYLEPSL